MSYGIHGGFNRRFLARACGGCKSCGAHGELNSVPDHQVTLI
jgi:hypothetical protein